jgi:peptidoglycan/LPS O-acetylase OafA/YrhL
MRKYWELWKDVLAAWAAVALVIYSIALACGMKGIVEELLEQYKLYFLLSVFVPYFSAFPLKINPSWWTKNRRRNLGYVLFALALISLIVWLIFAKTLSIWAQALYSLIPLILFAIGSVYAFMPMQRQPLQSEEPPSKAKKSEEAPSTPKPERAKIIGLAALLILLLAIVLTRKKRK